MTTDKGRRVFRQRQGESRRGFFFSYGIGMAEEGFCFTPSLPIGTVYYLYSIGFIDRPAGVFLRGLGCELFSFAWRRRRRADVYRLLL
ncbi:hypothetical protein GGR56DRAFT_619552 [Xylariaceae sp. FL0804]|nr:hypothetical protein GGR56DRAFT_619552 [Xylariaceae sp. FL0804]